MTVFYDANVLYDAGTKAMQSSKWKHETQLFEMNHLLETAHIQEQLKTGYQPAIGRHFIISERGKTRLITSIRMSDKAVIHVLCDEVLGPSVRKYLQYDNSASQKNKGVDFHRRRFENHLRQYYITEGTNEGYVLFVDFSGYYANIRHKQCANLLNNFIAKEVFDEETVRIAGRLIAKIFETFELDVSRLSDEEIFDLYHSKLDPMMNLGIPKTLLTGQKMLAKGVDLGNQLSQEAGIAYPYQVDNFIKIIKAVKQFGRYSDDFYAMHRSRQYLMEVLEGIRSISGELGLIINEKKTRICKMSAVYRHLQVRYSLTKTGRVIRRINPKSLTRERRKLKAYKRQLAAGKMDYCDIENCFKSWIGSSWKYMSQKQIKNMSKLYYSLFGRSISWKKRHGRLRWLMAL